MTDREKLQAVLDVLAEMVAESNRRLALVRDSPDVLGTSVLDIERIETARRRDLEAVRYRIQSAWRRDKPQDGER